MPLLRFLTVLGLVLLSGCASGSHDDHRTASPSSGETWALAVHGGAGVISKSQDPAVIEGYERSLEEAVELGKTLLESGRSALDVVEAVVRKLEDDPRFNAGRGAVLTHDRRHELDASIMDGRDLSCGAVTGVTTVRHPITLARAVMEKSRHVFFMGDGAEKFADGVGVERVPNSWFTTEKRKKALERALAGEEASGKGTVGCVALDRSGHLAAATSTGGMTNKRWGRIGDSPIIGAGTWADDRNCAVSCTGTGEEYIRRSVARDVAALWEYRGLSLEEATRTVVFEKLAKDDGGLIAVSKRGEISLCFNTPGMFRGLAHSDGRFEVKIWE